MIDADTQKLLGGVLGLLVVATIIGAILKRKATEKSRDTIDNLNARIRAWWIMVAIFGLSVLSGGIATIVLFALTSMLALREFITITPTRKADHRTLAIAFFVVTPLQYAILWIKWYGMLSIFVPVYAFLFIPTTVAIAGDTKDFLARVAKIQWALMICVYCVSHAPALLLLNIPGYEGQNAKLLLFLVSVSQLSDVMQYVFGKLFGRHKIAPNVSPNKTWEGFVGGIAAATGIGAALWFITPFAPLHAAGMALAITIMGFAGGLTMSAIKRDHGKKDMGTMIEGHGGVLDRIDSICFSAPLFFHLVRFFYEPIVAGAGTPEWLR